MRYLTFKDVSNFMEAGFIIRINDNYFGENSFNKTFGGNTDMLFLMQEISISSIFLKTAIKPKYEQS